MLVAGAIKLTAGKAKAPGAGAAQRAASVSAVIVQPHAFTDRIEALGVAKGRQSVTLTSNTPELVQAVRFRDGQFVSKGQVLVELRANEEDAGVAQARAQASQAQRDYDRTKILSDKGFVSKAGLEQQRAALETAKAVVAAAQARQGDRLVRAPFSGQVGLSDIAPGALIAAGGVIATLDDTSVIRVDFPVPERYLPVLREGAAITARPDAYPDVVVTGRIAQLDTRVDAATRAVTARAEFANSGGRLKPGMTVRVFIERGQRQALGAPESAVQFEGDQASVFVVAERGGKLAAQRRAVATGANQGGFVEITEGLKAGDRIVADGLNRIQDGQPVRVGGGRPPPRGIL